MRVLPSPTLILAAWLALLAFGAARAQSPLVADLSSHLIAITSSFAGTEVLLFGAIDQPGDVVVVVRGPREDVVVRRKQRVAGIWVNGSPVEFTEVPAFYAAASSQPLAEIGSPSLLSLYEIGLENIRLTAETELAAEELESYRDALIRRMRQRSLYVEDNEGVTFIGEQLFRVSLHFPATVPVGTYMAEVFLISDGQVIGAQTTPLLISKTGFEADLFDLAHQRPTVYGLLAIAVALAAGWLASVAFRRP